MGQEDGELVAAEPRDHVGLPQPPAQSPGHAANQLVAGLVAERIVDLLQVVEVDHEQGSLRPIAPSAPHVRLELALEAAPVQPPREGIVVGQVVQLFLVAAALADVQDLGQEVGGLALGVAQERGL